MKKIGVLGGGQLGMMLYQSEEARSVELKFLDPDANCSCKAIGAQVVQGDFKDYESVVSFGLTVDIITVEIEHVNIQALRELVKHGKEVYPQPDILEMIQDKGLQKQFYQNRAFPTSPFELIDSVANIDRGIWTPPFVLKSRKGGYDGKGVAIIRETDGLKDSISGACLVEQMADLEKELSVIVARSTVGEITAFPVVEMDFDPDANLVNALLSPANISDQIAKNASDLAKRLIGDLEMVGLLAVEMFLLKDGSLWVNEIAPRPHNSGHQTIEGNNTSQYSQHLKAITGAELGDTSGRGYAVMVNLLGEEGHEGPKFIEGRKTVDAADNAFLHDYCKELTRPKRKMGHITVVAEESDEAMNKALSLQSKVRYISK